MKKIILTLLLASSLYPQNSTLLLLMDDGKDLNKTSFTVTANTSSFVFNSGTNFQVAGTTGKVLNVDWGDGTVTNLTFTAPTTMQSLTKTYTNAGTYTVVITGWSDVKQLRMISLPGLTYNVNNNPLPSGLTYLTLANLGTNFTYNVNNNPLPSLLTTLYLANLGTGFIYNVNNNPLPSGLTYLYLEILGTGFTYNVNNNPLPSLLASLNLSTLGTGFTYNVNNNPLPSGLTTLLLWNLGTSITAGTLNNFVAINATTLTFNGSGNAVDISTGLTRAWNSCNILIKPQTGYGYTTAQIDAFLINYNAVAGTGTKTIDLRGANQPRSSASDAAVTSLQSKGRTILTNP